jgi:stress response protein YsnF
MAGATDYTTSAGTTGTSGTAYDSTVETTRSADYTTTQSSTTDYSTTGTGRAGFQEGTRDIGTEEGEMAIPVVEEELRVGTREVESGGERVDTRVEETPVEEQVTLREERVHVDRRPVNRPASDADFDRVQEGAVEVRERREEAVVDKQARVVEEVVINRDVEERTETIRDTVRRTDVDVDETPGRTSTTSTDLNQSGGVSDRGDNF